jgi:hypothetical protein
VNKEGQSEHLASAKTRALSQLKNHWNQIRNLAVVCSRESRPHAQRRQPRETADRARSNGASPNQRQVKRGCSGEERPIVRRGLLRNTRMRPAAQTRSASGAERSRNGGKSPSRSGARTLARGRAARNPPGGGGEPWRGAARLQTKPGARIEKQTRDCPAAPLREKAELPTAACCGAANPSARQTKRKIETHHEGGGASGEHVSRERKIATQDLSHSGGGGATRETLQDRQP